jgi:hypothetical protein
VFPKRTLALLIPAALAVALLPGRPAAARGWYEKAVKGVTARFDPAEAKPGQTVTFTLTVELNAGYHTYPTAQPDKQAAAYVNTLKFPDPDAVVFVGSVEDPKPFDAKAEPDQGIRELRTAHGKVTYTRKAVVSPKAAAGPATVKLSAFKLSVCDATNCFPPKDVPVEAALKVLGGPAVAVEKAYEDEVKKALEKK